ncbi:protein FAM90A5-like [Tamandua tetradactyla]|uniref:protein FAM90A5-like n=1 Tax=Tamandua tetradactyla TaxID=48850 RepID=UPI0040549C1B
MKQRQKRPAGLRAPPPEEEDARVKCKDCGAFGHTARSMRCPIKRWAQILDLQPLGSDKKDTENRDPCKAPQLQTTASLNKPARGDRQRQRGTHWKQQQDWTETPLYIRRPCRPMPLHATSKGPPPVPPPTCPPPPERPVMRSMDPALPLARKPGLSVFWPPGRDEAEEVDSPAAPQPASQHLRMDFAVTDQLAVQGPAACSRHLCRPARERPSQGHGLNFQAPAKGPAVNSNCSPQPVTERSEKDSSISIRARGKRSAQRPTQPCQNPPKKPRPSPFQPLRQGTQSPHQGVAHIPQALPSATALGPKEVPLYRRQVVRSTPVQVASRDLEDPKDRTQLSFVRACTTSHPPPSSQSPAQCLRMVFSRLGNGWWSSRFRTSLASPSPEKSRDPGQSPQGSEQVQAQCPRDPVTSLYEDLLVSSSEDSDWD